jgi:NitT/TauT family transport system substrate-binding protein
MPLIQTRRELLTSLTAAGAFGVLGSNRAVANEGPPEVTTIRIRSEDVPGNVIKGVVEATTCIAPTYIAKDLLRTEGFSDIRYVPVKSGPSLSEAFARGDIDFDVMFAPEFIGRVDAGAPIAALAGMHPGCFELFAHEPIQRVTDLKGKKVGINEALGSANYLFVSIMAAHVGLNRDKDIHWITTNDVPHPKELFVQGELDAYLAYVSELPELRTRKTAHVIVDMAMDQPWSQYFCCIVIGNPDFVRQYPVATKRALRAILKATDLCATEPERAARLLVESGYVRHYDVALQPLRELPYNVWRELDPEDSIRFYSLWMHEFGMLSSTPNKIIAEATDWRFLNELKRELKA